MKLHRDLGITQKAAWFMAHRIREAMANQSGSFFGPVEADETYIGGKRKNMPKAMRKELTGRGAVGKAVVAGAKDRDTNAVIARVVEHPDAEMLQGFVIEPSAPDAKTFIDDTTAYKGIPRDHEAVNHSIGEYVRGQAHTNGIESLWSMLKRGYVGTFHQLSEEHLQRYANEFAGRHNVRQADTIDQMAGLATGMTGKRLRYRDLTA